MKFQNGDNVEIHSTTSAELDGQKCRVVGRSYHEHQMSIYLVRLQKPVASSDGFLNEVAAITEHCLRPIGTHSLTP